MIVSRKGFDRHNRKFQAKQQAANKFSQKRAEYNFFGFIDSDEPDAKAVKKLINKVTR